MIPIGATVRWRPAIDKRATVIGVATARRPERTGDQIEIDHRDWWVSEALLEVGGEMITDYSDANARAAGLKALTDARDDLARWYDEAQQALNEAGYGPGSAADGVRSLNCDLTAAVTERDALRELVVAQATKNAELAQELQAYRMDDENIPNRVAELEEWTGNVQSYVEDLLLLFVGERRPVRPIEPPELRRLAEFVFEGV